MSNTPHNTPERGSLPRQEPTPSPCPPCEEKERQQSSALVFDESTADSALNMNPNERVHNGRLTIVETVYWQQQSSQPKAVETRFGRILKSDEPPYQRPKYVCTEDWQPIDLGWLRGKSGIITISNEEGKYLSVIPTEGERAAIAARVIELGVAATVVPPDRSRRTMLDELDVSVIPFGMVRPGEDCRLEFYDTVMVRCRKGKAVCVLTVMPQ